MKYNCFKIVLISRLYLIFCLLKSIGWMYELSKSYSRKSVLYETAPRQLGDLSNTCRTYANFQSFWVHKIYHLKDFWQPWMYTFRPLLCTEINSLPKIRYFTSFPSKKTLFCPAYFSMAKEVIHGISEV